MWADGSVKRLSKADILRNNLKCLFNMSKKKGGIGEGHTWELKKGRGERVAIIGQYYDFNLILTLIRFWLKRKHVFVPFCFCFFSFFYKETLCTLVLYRRFTG